ncbi:TetR/AcrR family transcriptional regulator [Nocardia cerradoensis]|uniref:TetR/AcrR family transcriptional regulator n=1 Tax=Nocardia cerradoensis TaxID=85688 RepID=UPI001CB8CE30|nr:TetR/AcrR family transcriptional regulator [Nocardia cerradoensis]
MSALTRRVERRKKLIAAGRRVWGTRGVDGVSVRGVCADAGLTSRYFYEHFAGRDELITDVAGEVWADILGLLVSTGLRTEGGLEPRLQEALTTLFDLLIDDPSVHRIVTDVTTASSLTNLRSEALDQLIDSVLQFGPALMDVELPGPAQVRHGAIFIVGGITAILQDWLLHSTESASELAATCTRLTMATITAAGLEAGP